MDALPELAPLAEHERLKVLLPPTLIIIDSEPEAPFEPDQEPDAEQLVARVDDQFKVIEALTSAELAEVDMETVIFCWVEVEVGVRVGAAEPPPPPPPQLSKKKEKIS